MLADDNAVIEVAVIPGDNRETEPKVARSVNRIELKSGNPDSLLIWAQKLAQQCPVFLNLVSKAEQVFSGRRNQMAHARAVENAG